jgi:hypothetical protein
LYSPSDVLFTVIAIVAFLLLRHVALLLTPSSRTRALVEAISLLPAATAALGTIEVLDRIVHLGGDLLLPAFALVFAALAFEISSRAGRGGVGYRRLAAASIGVGLVGNLLLFGDPATATLCLVFGLATVVAGHMVEQRSVFALGLTTLVVGLVYQLHFVIALFDLGSWASLALLGVAAILFGSAIERHGQRLKHVAAKWGRQFRAWEN